MHSACTICTETSLNGRKIAGTRITTVHQLMVVLGLQVIVPSGCCGAVLGVRDPRTASGALLQAGTATSVSVLPGPIKSWVLASLNLVF